MSAQHGFPVQQSSLVDDIHSLEGSWVSVQSHTHLYARVIDGDLVVPYCFGGNGKLTSVFYSWKRIGDLWFARFCWLTKKNVAGYTFLKRDSIDRLTGAWWGSEDPTYLPPKSLDLQTGIAVRWERRAEIRTPDWALCFFDEVKREGLAGTVAQKVAMEEAASR